MVGSSQPVPYPSEFANRSPNHFLPYVAATTTPPNTGVEPSGADLAQGVLPARARAAAGAAAGGAGGALHWSGHDDKGARGGGSGAGVRTGCQTASWPLVQCAEVMADLKVRAVGHGCQRLWSLAHTDRLWLSWRASGDGRTLLRTSSNSSSRRRHPTLCQRTRRLLCPTSPRMPGCHPSSRCVHPSRHQ